MREASKTWILAIQAKHVKEVPLDPSLLAQGAKNYGTHRLRRRGLPTHVPKAWLGQHSAAASGLCSPVKSEVGNPITLISAYGAVLVELLLLCFVSPQDRHTALPKRKAYIWTFMHAGAEMPARLMLCIQGSLPLRQAEEDFTIKAARPSCATESFEVNCAPPGSSCSHGLGKKGYDSSYSYVFPSTHRR